jgi:hypothetical protein
MIDKKQPENVEYFNYLGRMITSDARCVREIKSRIDVEKQHLITRRIFTSKLDLNLKSKLVMCYIWSIAFIGAENWTLRIVDRKYLESCEM